MFTNLSKPTKAMKDEMDKLGISITDSNGEMLPMRDVMDQLRTKMGGLSKDQQAAAASTIFGKEAMSGALAVINASDEDYKKLTKSIDGSKGASKRMAKEMEGGIGGAMRKMKSAIESLAISLGDALAPMLYKAAKWITSLANKFLIYLLAFKNDCSCRITRRSYWSTTNGLWRYGINNWHCYNSIRIFNDEYENTIIFI